jgi:hypothetical protein
MEYSLLWKGRLWKVTVPEEVGSKHWLYVQAFVVSEGNHGEAMRAVLRERYPGIGWSGFNTNIQSFGSALSYDKSYRNGSSLSSVPSDKSYRNGSSLSSVPSDKSYPTSSSNSHSHTPRPPSSKRPAKDAESGTVGPCKPALRHATSTASRPPVPLATVALMNLRTKRHATPHTVGWMGSTATTA